MPLKPKKVASVLESKFGFEEAKEHSDDHKWLALRLDGIPAIITKLSHSRDDIGKKLEGMIARQLRVEKQFFVGMIECTNDRDTYYTRLRTNPVPSFDDVRF
jgi:hypothetical protein